MSVAPNPIPPPPLHSVYLYTVYLFTQGRVGGVEPERILVRGATDHKAGLETPTLLTVTPAYNL